MPEVNLDQEENLVWLDLLEGLGSQECLVKLVDKVLLVLLECQVLKVLMDLEVHQEAEDHLESQE